MRKLSTPQKPAGLARLAFRLPILLYRAHPEATIQMGRRALAVDAVPLTAEEGGELMAHYAVRHGTAAKKLCKFMGFEVDGSAEDYRLVGREIPFLRFVPRVAPA